MTPRDFYTLAEELIEGDGEAHWRSAVSRAYYAAFHVARQLMERCGFAVPRDEKGHRHMTHRFSNSGHEQVREAGDRLETLRRDRNQADYDLFRPITRLKADQLVEAARAIIEALEAVDAATQAAIIQAMRDYERDALKDITWKV